MIESEREKLLAKKSEYLSIGITEGGVPCGTTPIPWEKTVHAHNMKTPDVYLAPEDLEDEEILKTLHGYKVIGCYIYTSLESYAFLASFTEIRDLSIRAASGLENLDFLPELSECGMLYLEGARLDNLDAVAELKKSTRGIFAPVRCLGLCDCEIEDISSLKALSFSELIVWGKGDRERWSEIPASTHGYYEL